MKLACKITLNGPAPCVPSPFQAYYPIFWNTPSSGPHYSLTTSNLYFVIWQKSDWPGQKRVTERTPYFTVEEIQTRKVR